MNNIILHRMWDLARLGCQWVSPNPCVGAVIIYQNTIIGESWHQKFGEAHAEVNAINSVQNINKENIKKSSIFVTLEPCFHFGKTPPCVNLLLNHHLKDVHIHFQDPNPLVAGQSIRKLKLAGTNVHQLNNTSTDISTKTTIIDPFFTNIKENRPYIILKWAETADCYMGCRSKPVPISNKYAQRLVHKWRSESDAIMIGSNTALIDDPQLNNRYYFGKSPVRIVIDKDNSLPPQLKIFDNKAETIIFNQIKNNQNKNVEFKQIPFDDNLLDSILNYLFSKKIGILFVEGGATLLQSFIGKNLWDEVRILKSKNNLRDIVNSDKIEGITAPKLTYGKLQTESQLYDNQLLIFKNS